VPERMTALLKVTDLIVSQLQNIKLTSDNITYLRFVLNQMREMGQKKKKTLRLILNEKRHFMQE
jgi:hypothetical protein